MSRNNKNLKTDEYGMQATTGVDAQQVANLMEEIGDIRVEIEQMQSDKDVLLAVFGIWASLIAFFTVEFQFLKSLYSWQKIMGFSFLWSALLLIFNLCLYHFLLKKEKEMKKLLPLYLIALLLFFGGNYYVNQGNEEAAHRYYIYKQAYATFQEEQGKLYKSYDQKIDVLSTENQKKQDEIVELKSDVRMLKDEIKNFKAQKHSIRDRVI